MFEPHLYDLDELVLAVRDRNSRDYINEAVVAYRARAYRSAILSAWVAVTYDIIAKIRELAGQRDKAAAKFVADLDAAIGLTVTDYAAAVVKLQQNENELLAKALKEFEFLTAQEHTDLERLKHDRNLCAHPAFTGETTLFQPNPELVRTHITHAILHLLQHPPVQGKTALGRLKNDIMQPSFPADQREVTAYVEESYFRRAKRGLLDNFMAVFLKTLIKQSEPDMSGKESSVLKCLIALSITHAQVFERQMIELLPQLTDGLDDQELKRVFFFFRVDRRCWSWLSRSVRIKLLEIAKKYKYNAADVELIVSGLEIDELRPIILKQIEGFGDTERLELFAAYQRPEFVDAAIELYTNVSNFRRSERIAQGVMLPMCSMFGAEHVERILKAAETNVDIYEAAGSPAFFRQMFERTGDLHREAKVAWQRFVSKMRERKGEDDYYAYPALRKEMERVGMWPPPAAVGN